MHIKDGYMNSAAKTPITKRGFTLQANDLSSHATRGNPNLTTQGPVAVEIQVTTGGNIYIDATTNDLSSTTGHVAYPLAANSSTLIGLKQNEHFKITVAATCFPFDNCPAAS